ncbi:MAG TPA: discoidin domain-containing protein [Candidatus Limnocylindria bacterium]|nr:discoidin domain-containing protein [Candidatus Limnocylindria bacterium]
MIRRSGMRARTVLAAALILGPLLGGATPAAAVIPQSCVDGMVSLMQQTTMDLDSAYRLHQATLDELRLAFGDRDGASAQLDAATTSLLNVQTAALNAAVNAVNSYQPPLTATMPGPVPTLTYSAAGSTTWSVYVPANAVDANDTTKWSSTNPVAGNWLMADVGAAVQIDRFRVLQASHPDWQAWGYRVQSADAPAGPWTDLHQYTGGAPADSGVVAFAAGPVTARYWRVLADRGGGNGWEVFTFTLFPRAIVVATADPDSCLDGLALQLQELVAAAAAAMDAVVADVRLSVALLPLPGAAPTVVVPTSKDACKDGGWKLSTLGFKNQGQCVSWVVAGRRNVAEKNKGLTDKIENEDKSKTGAEKKDKN